MHLSDYLGAFSVADLRELVRRTGLIPPEYALRSRQTLVRTIAAVLTRQDFVYTAVSRLNQAEVAVLYHLVHSGKGCGRSQIGRGTGTDPGLLQPLLESLRLSGLAFPEGDWEHIVLLPALQSAAQWLPGLRQGSAPPLAEVLQPPALHTSQRRCEQRSGSFAQDLAELLARLARSRMRPTKAGALNRRDLKGVEDAMSVAAAPGYVLFLSLFAARLGLFAIDERGEVFRPTTRADAWLAQPPEARAASLAAAWPGLHGYPENIDPDPAEGREMGRGTWSLRGYALELLREPAFRGTVTAASVAERVKWLCPHAFEQWEASRDHVKVTKRLLRSLFWLGFVAADDPALPAHARVTPMGARASSGDFEDAGLIPDEPQFFLQPNAELFAPPNLSPRTFFHLRRVTGEKKGGAAGMFPITQDSIRRVLDSGSTVPEILTFLELFSCTGVPPNIRNLVETAGRQHGRIRLVPAGYVALTDTPELLSELRSLRTVAPLLGEGLTERAAAVDADDVGSLMSALRARGYAPLNTAETGSGPSLPTDPACVPELSAEPYATPELTVDWERIPEEEQGRGVCSGTLTG